MTRYLFPILLSFAFFSVALGKHAPPPMCGGVPSPCDECDTGDTCLIGACSCNEETNKWSYGEACYKGHYCPPPKNILEENKGVILYPSPSKNRVLQRAFPNTENKNRPYLYSLFTRNKGGQSDKKCKPGEKSICTRGIPPKCNCSA